MTEEDPKYSVHKLTKHERKALKKRGNAELAKLANKPAPLIPRCAPCRRGGTTDTNVVALATAKTPDCVAGDFLCLLHDHRTSMPLPDNVKAGQN